MKIEIAILGSTGSIGKSLLDIIEKDQKKFDIKLLTANKDYRTLLNQAKKFNVKNLIITDQKSFKKIKEKIKIFNLIFIIHLKILIKYSKKYIM